MTDGLPPGQVAVSVSTGPGVAALVHPGDWVDVLAGPPDDVGLSAAAAQPDSGSRSGRGDAAVIAEAVAVLAVLPAAAAFDNGDTQVVVATDRGTALRIVAVQGRQTLAVVVDPP
jgi:Flp pilus assembly protein CpaB